MRNIFLTSLVVCSAIGLGAQVHAQQPAPTPAPVPEAMPFNIPYGSPITLERAKQVADAAEAEAKKRNWKLAIAIVDPSGTLVYFVRADDTQLASIRIAQEKARASAQFRRPTKVFQDVINGGTPSLITLPGVVGSEGGNPLIENGKLIGAIGVSGATGGQDNVVSMVGAALVK